MIPTTAGPVMKENGEEGEKSGISGKIIPAPFSLKTYFFLAVGFLFRRINPFPKEINLTVICVADMMSPTYNHEMVQEKNV
jgi:hypothetical protein